MNDIAAPDLTKRPPRSPRVRLGGYVLLPRMLDKCRADLAGKVGEYKYACPLDQRLLEFLGVDAEAFKTQVATGAGDGDMLAWIEKHQKTPRTAWEIAHWSDFQDRRGPDGDVETLGFFLKYVSALSASREDLRTWADVLDLDDHVTFGGKA
jgi:hypothetical protein